MNSRSLSRSHRLVSPILILVMLTAMLPPSALSKDLGILVAHAAPRETQFATEVLAGALQPAQVSPESPAEALAPPQPAALDSPISVSRVQSAYRAADAISETLVITFTVTNNLPPAQLPRLPSSPTLTDTLDLLAVFDYARDPHTIHDAMLADALTAEVSFVSDSPLSDRSGDSLAWNLGDIPPLSSASVQLTVQVPTGIAGFLSLDTGATAWGALQGRGVTAQAAPATLAPDLFGDWLIWTMDANIYDQYMLEKAAELGQDPLRIFEYVRALGYEAYSGSLRGTRGTLWGEAGNAADQASLLIAMLRASGIPSRYRHGTLDQSSAQQLIASMFPTPTRVAGHVPTDSVVNDPTADTQLLAVAADHWWVEAYLPGQGWRDLDPCFSDAVIGQCFVADENLAVDGTDGIAELPDALRHKVTVKVRIEEYHPMNVGGSMPGLQTSYPLQHTFNVVELLGDPVTLGHMVSTEGQSGPVFFYVRHTYVPYLRVGDSPIVFEGEAFQDLRSNFPFGTVLHTGEWLVFEIQHPDGRVQTYEREVVDLLGYAARHTTTTATVNMPEGNDPLFTIFDLYTTWFWPYHVPIAVGNRSASRMMGTLETVNDDLAELQGMGDEASLSAEQRVALREIKNRFQTNMGAFLGDLGLAFGGIADRALSDLESGLLVKAYYDAPRIVTIASEADEQIAFNMDLRRTLARTIPYPGQTLEAAYGLQMTKGFAESALEAEVLTQATNQPAVSTARVFKAAGEQGIPAVLINEFRLPGLEALDVSEEAKARVAEAVRQGRLVLIPERSVDLDGQSVVGWWELDPQTGETVGVMENGLHNAFIEWLFDPAFLMGAQTLVGYMQGLSTYNLIFLGQLMEKLFEHPERTIKDVFNRAQAVFDVVGAYGTSVSCFMILSGVGSAVDCVQGLLGVDPFTQGGKTARGFLERVLSGWDPPLPDSLLGYPLAGDAQATASALVQVPAAYPDTAVSLAVQTGMARASGQMQASWTAVAQNAFAVSSLQLASATLYDSDGGFIGTGAVSAVPDVGPEMYLLTASTPIDLMLDGTGSIGLHAPAVAGLGAGSSWLGYLAQLSAAQPYTLVLTDALISLNATEIVSGPVLLVADGAAILTGRGSTAVPDYAEELLLIAEDAALQIGPATGQVYVGPHALDPSLGLALADYTGPLTITEVTTATDRDGPRRVGRCGPSLHPWRFPSGLDHRSQHFDHLPGGHHRKP